MKMRIRMDMLWTCMKSAPKDGKPFLAWYGKHVFGPPFGTMAWIPDKSKEGGRFHSMTMGTQTKDATHWLEVHEPRDWEGTPKNLSRLFVHPDAKQGVEND